MSTNTLNDTIYVTFDVSVMSTVNSALNGTESGIGIIIIYGNNQLKTEIINFVYIGMYLL